MSKTEGKRGLARTQHAASAPSPAFDEAWAKFEAEEAAFEALPFVDGCLPPDAAVRRDLAADGVFSTPAPDGAALARKIELFAYPMHIDGRLSDPSVRSRVATDGGEDERKLLVMYLDALALAGQRARVVPSRVERSWDAAVRELEEVEARWAPLDESAAEFDEDHAQWRRAMRQVLSLVAPDWAGIAFKVNILALAAEGLDVRDEPAMAAARLRTDLSGQLAHLYDALGLATDSQPSAVMATAALEQLGKDFAADIYPRFACNPEGLGDIVGALTGAQADARDLLRRNDPKAAAAIIEGVYFRKDPPPPSETTDPAAMRRASEWREARDATFAAFEAHKKSDSDEDFDALCTAQEKWEALTPPDLEALAEVVGYSLAHFGPLDMSYQSADDPRAIRDLLDHRAPGELIAARVYLHLLRMTGSRSPALLTPPIGGLFPAFDPLKVENDEPGDEQRAWEAHHSAAQPYPNRVAEFALWEQPGSATEKGIFGRAAVRAHGAYATAVVSYARVVVGQYEARGGSFNLVRQPDGELWLGTTFARDGSAEAREIQRLIASREHLRRAVADFIEHRDGVLGESRGAA